MAEKINLDDGKITHGKIPDNEKRRQGMNLDAGKNPGDGKRTQGKNPDDGKRTHGKIAQDGKRSLMTVKILMTGQEQTPSRHTG